MASGKAAQGSKRHIPVLQEGPVEIKGKCSRPS